MEKFYKQFGSFIIMILAVSTAFAQTTISGTIKDKGTGVEVAGVNILVKGRVVGTISDSDGKFELKVKEEPPFTLVISFIGYKSQEIEITTASSTLNIDLEEQSLLGQEIVISASRVEESIMESPVSIEKMSSRDAQTTPADNYYKGLANLKGIDVATSSINFQILNARGFGSTGNTRFVQLTDGMDTQAPALNFPIGNLNGPSELDVESVEMLPGASSALYGPNAFNGIILVTSKSPFDYQGLSAMTKVGMNHVGSDADYSGGPSPVWEGAIRYAKSFNNKFAFKVNLAYMKAQDWHGTDATDREIGRTPTGFSSNPGSDLYHSMGDEASINLAIFPNSAPWQTYASTSSAFYNNIFEPGVSALSYAQAGDLPSQIVSVSPYKEKDLIDYGAQNAKINTGLYYRINDKLELSLLYNGGFGTSIYTGAQRYSLNNFGISQYRAQLRGDNFFLRAYTTMENSGDSYITEFLAKRVNDLAVAQANPLFSDVSGYLATYSALYLRSLYDQGYTPGEINTVTNAERIAAQQIAHAYARDVVNNGGLVGGINYIPMHLDPSSQNFKDIKKEALKGTVPTGPKFADKTNLYHVEGQYDFKNQLKTLELQVGGSYRLYDLNSNGTIFDDGDENITIKEFGAYVQAGKWLGDHKFKLSGSLRFDKNENFDGRINPRISAVYKVSENHNIRASFQTGFRNPSTQGQHIDLDIISSRLLGGLQRYADKYEIPKLSSTSQYLSFEGTSVQAFRSNFFSTGDMPSSIALLTPFTKFDPVKPEQIKSIEVGYKGLLNNNFLIDMAYYYNSYNDFITQVQVINAAEGGGGAPNYLTILNSTSANTFSIYTNAPGTVTAQGYVAGLTYNLPRGYTISGNYNWNTIGDTPEGFVAEFNTPENKVNLSFSNRKVTENIGFNVTWRWQSEFDWQSSFTLYTLYRVPSYNTVDAQVTYKLSSLKSMIKVGGSNILNNKYIQSGGGPNISGLYYISIVFDQLMN